MAENDEERQPVKDEFIEKMGRLRDVVRDLSNLYEENDWLNDEFNIEKLVPMSLDEWEPELAAFLENPTGYHKP